MKRYGTVLTFKKGIAEEEIRIEMKKIERILEKEWYEYEQPIPKGTMTSKEWRAIPKHLASYVLQEYDDEDGRPTWHMP